MPSVRLRTVQAYFVQHHWALEEKFMGAYQIAEPVAAKNGLFYESGSTGIARVPSL